MPHRSSLASSFCPRALANVAQSPEYESWADFSQAARCHARSAKAIRRGYNISSNWGRVRIVSVHTWDWIPVGRRGEGRGGEGRGGEGRGGEGRGGEGRGGEGRQTVSPHNIQAPYTSGHLKFKTFQGYLKNKFKTVLMTYELLSAVK